MRTGICQDQPGWYQTRYESGSTAVKVYIPEASVKVEKPRPLAAPEIPTYTPSSGVPSAADVTRPVRLPPSSSAASMPVARSSAPTVIAAALSNEGLLSYHSST